MEQLSLSTLYNEKSHEKINFHQDTWFLASLDELQALRTALVNVQRIPATPPGTMVLCVLADNTTINAPASVPELKCLIKKAVKSARDRIKAMGAEQHALLDKMEALNTLGSVSMDDTRAYVDKTTAQILETIDSHRFFKPDVNLQTNRVDTFVPGHQRAARRAQAKKQAKQAK